MHSTTSLYFKKVYPNGLTLLTVPIETSSSVTMSVFVKAGSRYEAAEQNGISHFLEHLHFKGSKKFRTAKKLSEAVDSIGGEFNANTGKEHTQYYIRAAYEHLPLVFDVLTDMVQNPLFEEKEIEREKGVIIEEINMYKDNPQVNVDSIFEETLWPGNALGRDIAGTPGVIRRLGRGDIRSYRRSFYQPGNMIIALAGNFSQDQVEKMVEKRWARLKTGKFGGYESAMQMQTRPRATIQYKSTEQAYMIAGFGAYPYGHKKNPALRVMSAVLGGGMSSRLFLAVRERRGLAYYVYTSYNNYLDAGNFTVQAGLKVSSAPEALSMVLGELKKIRDNGISAAELKKAKEYLKGKIALALEDPHDKMEWYLAQEAFTGRIKTIKQTFEDYESVTNADIKSVAKELIRNDNLNLAVIGPFKDPSIFEKRLKL